MLMQYGHIAQHDQVAGPLYFHYFSLSANEYKIISFSLGGLGTATCYNQT